MPTESFTNVRDSLEGLQELRGALEKCYNIPQDLKIQYSTEITRPDDCNIKSEHCSGCTGNECSNCSGGVACAKS